jgi:hypothetical protein
MELRFRMCFAKFWPFYLWHQQCYISGMHPGYIQWKKNTGFTQTSCSLYFISIYFDYLLGLNKIPCLLYEQLLKYTTIWFKRNILFGSILSLSYVNLSSTHMCFAYKNDFTEDTIKKTIRTTLAAAFCRQIWQLLWDFWYTTINTIYVYCRKIYNSFPLAAK